MRAYFRRLGSKRTGDIEHGIRRAVGRVGGAIERAEMRDSPEAAYEVMVAEGQVFVRRADEPPTLSENLVGR